MENKTDEKILTWDDACEVEFNVLPEGAIVDFTVVDVIKGRNAKKNCPTMEVCIKATSKEYGDTDIKETYNLTSKGAYFIKQIMTACNIYTNGKTMAQLASELKGKKGRAKVRVNSWEYNGMTYSNNRISEFLEGAPSGDNSDDDNNPW